MKHSRKLAFALLILAVQAMPVKAQDWGGSYNLEFSKKLAKGLDLTLEEELRTRNNFRSIDRMSSTLGMDYKLADFIKVGADYTLINYDAIENKYYDWEIRHRWSVFATLSKKIGRVNFTWREKFQQTYRNGVPAMEVDNEYDPISGDFIDVIKRRGNPKKVIRSRLRGAWDIKSSKFEPYASVELYHLLNDPNNSGLGTVKYTIGTDFKLTKNDKVTIFYRYEDERTTNRTGDEEDPNMNYIGVGYSHEF